FLDTNVRANFAAMRLQMFSKSECDAVHPTFDQIIANVLQDGSEKPTEFGATSVVGRRAEKGGERTEQGFSRFCFEGLVRPRADTLHAKPISFHARGGRSEVGRRRWKWRRR